MVSVVAIPLHYDHGTTSANPDDTLNCHCNLLMSLSSLNRQVTAVFPSIEDLAWRWGVVVNWSGTQAQHGQVWVLTTLSCLCEELFYCLHHSFGKSI